MDNSIWDWIQRHGAPPKEPAKYPVIPDTSTDYKPGIFKLEPREQFIEWFNNL